MRISQELLNELKDIYRRKREKSSEMFQLMVKMWQKCKCFAFILKQPTESRISRIYRDYAWDINIISGKDIEELKTDIMQISQYRYLLVLYE